MIISNFSFLKPLHPNLADLGYNAEKYSYSDPQSAVVKLRCFAEVYTGFIYQELSLPASEADNLFARIDNNAFQTAVEDCVTEKLHLIRMKGNKAAHDGGVSISDALLLIKEAYFLAAWIYLAYFSGKPEELPKYQEPKPLQAKEQHLKRDKQRLQESLNLQTADLQQAKAELQAAQKQQKEVQEQLVALNLEIDQYKLAALQQQGQFAVNNFDFHEEETRKQIRMTDVFAEYQLTSGQSELVGQLEEFLTSNDNSVFLLKGYAGTGKTFITKGLTEYFKAVGRSFVLAAPTGKAAKVIASKTGCEAYTIHKTIYSFKDVIEYREDNLEGSETYKVYAQLAVNDMSADTVFVIDESSMIHDVKQEQEFFRCGCGFLLKDFLKFVNLDHNDHRKKVIFIGDDAQLPPVGMSFSPALDADYLLREHNIQPIGFELTEVVRQKSESGVMANAMKLRQSLDSGMFNQLAIEMEAADLEKVEYQNLIPTYLNACESQVNNKAIVIAASNADVTAYNRQIREHLFPGHPEITHGDKVMVTSNSNTYGFYISNGDFGFVRAVLSYPEERPVTLKRRNQTTGEIEHISVLMTFRDVNIGFRNLEGEPVFFNAKIIENLLYSEHPNLSSDQNKALYVDFCIRHSHLRPGTNEFKDTLRSDPYFNALRLKFGYAITCHKAQGTEWAHVFVKCRTHLSQLTADYFRWLYTAITRTSSKLYLLEPPNLRLGGGMTLIPNPCDTLRASQPLTDSLQTAAVQQESDQVSLAHEEETNTFGIPQSANFLLGILHRVRQLTDDSGIEIDSISHNQYQEAYIFKCDNEFSRINIFYNGRSRVSRVDAAQLTELGSQLTNLLAPLIREQFIAPSEQGQTQTFVFDQVFLNEFHARLTALAEAQGITIEDVRQQQWCQRYTFSRGSEVAVYDIWYNGRSQFTRCGIVPNTSTPGRLTEELQYLLTEGMSA